MMTAAGRRQRCATVVPAIEAVPITRSPTTVGSDTRRGRGCPGATRLAAASTRARVAAASSGAAVSSLNARTAAENESGDRRITRAPRPGGRAAGGARETGACGRWPRGRRRSPPPVRRSARALAAWDDYLAAFPRGTFAPEARFNRAVCLVRIGRAADAEAALRPFAEGKLAGYRQADAERLLAWLRERPPASPVP